jgi:hypothetical protein
MKTRLLVFGFVLAIVTLACVTGCCSGTKLKSSSAQKVENAELVDLGKIHYERGDLETAAKVFQGCLRADPQDKAAPYYLNLVREAEFQQTLVRKDLEPRIWRPTIPPRPVE